MGFWVEEVTDEDKKYFLLKNENLDIVEPATTYLVYRSRINRSPNTVRADAFALQYYCSFLQTSGLVLQDVVDMPYLQQDQHFKDYLQYMREGHHKTRSYSGEPSGRTCNTHLAKVFQFYSFLTDEGMLSGKVKVLTEKEISISNAVGVKKRIACKEFRGYLKNEPSHGKSASREEIQAVLSDCTNSRDVALILLLVDTGMRIGEALGVDYTNDLDLDACTVRVIYRGDNENGARAKNAEYRTVYFSANTGDVLAEYITKYRDLLKNTKYLFINLNGRNRGKALTANAVYAMLRRHEEKTGVKITPHMLRHYFANERRKAGWDLFTIQTALGHQKIDTTEKYLNIVTEELAEASKAYHDITKGMYGINKLL